MSIRLLSTELQAKAIAELHEDPERIQDDIAAIKEWLSQQKHINARMEDQFILTFLRGCKFSLEKTKSKLEYVHTIRTLLPEFFETRDPFLPEIQALLELGVVLPLKPTGPDSPVILLCRHFLTDPVVHKTRDMFKVTMMIIDILLYDNDQITIGGMITVFDTSKMPLAYMAHLELSILKKVATYLDKGLPQRPQKIYIFNPSIAFETVYGLVKPFVREKLQKRIIFHKSADNEDLFKHIPKIALPTEYGGDAGPIQDIIDYWKEKVESRARWFKEDEQYKSDESKRVGKPKTPSDLFGIEGSFRKLNVD